MPQPRTLMAALYLRVSTVDQGRRGFSLPEQRKACLDKAQALARAAAPAAGAPPALDTMEYVDTAGGDLLERPELERLRRFVRDCRPAYVICLDPDRFSRSTAQAILVANEIEAAGTRLEFVQHDYQCTSEGRLFFTLRVAIAEYEKAKILERTRRGKQGKMAAGGVPHRIHVYGYDFVPGGRAGGPLVPNPAEAAWVRQMVAWVVQERLGSQAIAQRLNRLQVPAKNGAVWHRSVVADILRNPIYIGRLRLHRYDWEGLGAQSQLPRERRTRKLTPRLRPPADWVVVPVPALLPEALYAQAQEVLAQMRRRAGTHLRPGRRGHLLSGLATCGRCGAPMHYVWNAKISGYFLRCANRYPLARGLREPPPACPHPHRRAEPVEQAVWQQALDWLLAPEVLQAERAGPGPAPDTAAPRAFLVQRLAEAKARQARVLRLVGQGVVHPDVARAQLAELGAHIAALEREQAALAAADAAPPRRPAPAAETGDPAAAWRARFGQLGPADRQMVLRMLLKQVRVHPGGGATLVPAGLGESPLDPHQGPVQPAGRR